MTGESVERAVGSAGRGDVPGASTTPTAGRSILRDASQYTGATYVAWLGVTIVGLATKGLLGPTNVGIWSLLNILLGYLAAIQLGGGDAVAKEVPYLRQKGRLAEARELGDAMLGYVLVASIALGVVLVAMAIWQEHRFSGPLFTGLVVVGAGFPLWMYANMQIMTFRAAKRFDVLSRQLLLQVIVTAAVGLPLIWRWSINGQFALYVLSSCVFIGYFLYAARRAPEAQFRPRLRMGATRRLVAVGLPLQVTNLVLILQSTADSLLAARSLGITALGFYSLAVTVKAYIYQTPTAFAVVMFPRFQERFAESSDDPAALREYVEKPILAFAFLVLPLLIGVSWEGVPFLVRHLLPAFTPAIGPIRLLLVGTFFASLWQTPAQFLIAINKIWHGAALSLASAALVTLGVSIALSLRGKVEAVAIGTSTAYAVAALGTIWYALSHFRRRWEVAGFLLKLVGAAGLLFVALVLADRVVPVAPELGRDLVRLCLRSLCLVAAAAPLFWYAERTVGVRNRLRRRAVGSCGAAPLG